MFFILLILSKKTEENMNEHISYVYIHGFNGVILKTYAYIKTEQDKYFVVNIKLSFDDYKAKLSSKKIARMFANVKLNKYLKLINDSTVMLKNKIKNETMKSNKEEKLRRIRKSELLSEAEIKGKVVNGLVKSKRIFLTDYKGINDLEKTAVYNNTAIERMVEANKTIFSKQLFKNF